MQNPTQQSRSTTSDQVQHSRIQEAQRHIMENGDIELTIVLSIAAGVLNLFGIVDYKVATGFILTIFSLVAINILRSRGADKEMGKMIVSVEKEVPAIKKVGDHLETVKKVADHLPGVETKIDSVERHMPIIDDVERELPDIAMVAKHLPHITAVLEKLKMYSRQIDAEKFLLSYVMSHATGENKIRKATIMRYSILPELIGQLLENGAEVTVFTQAKETAEQIGSQYQAKCIAGAYEGLKSRLSPNSPGSYPLTIYEYTPPCSMVGINFDDELIYMGWYTYEYSDELNKIRVDCENDTVQLYGHDKAALVVQKGYEGFGVLDVTFKSIVDNYKRNAKCIQFPEKSDHPALTLVS